MKLNRSQKLFLISALIGFITGIFLKAFFTGRIPQDRTGFERIVIIGPNITEILFALDQDKKIVGIDEFSQYPAATENIEKVGGILNPNLEKILSLNADLLFISGSSNQIENFCRSHSIEFIPVFIDDTSSIYSSIENISDILTSKTYGDSLCTKLRSEINNITSNTPEYSPSVLVAIVYGNQPPEKFMTVSDRSFIGELVNIAGGRNVFSDIPIPYPEVSKESIIIKDPDIILVIKPSNEIVNSGEIIRLWQETYPNLKAVISNSIYILSDDYILIPGPRFILTAKIFNEIFTKRDYSTN